MENRVCSNIARYSNISFKNETSATERKKRFVCLILYLLYFYFSYIKTTVMI